MGLFRATSGSTSSGCFGFVGFGVSCFCEVAEEVHFDTVRAVVVRTVGDGGRGVWRGQRGPLDGSGWEV
jgi:hypothetical protein